ncbi:hypothetical protein C8R48DRAFT_672111 [Suillus tomentosus]|nr:hypothetical protein C8R48DRAFT_672111 [Suillus tomentosus]
MSAWLLSAGLEVGPRDRTFDLLVGLNFNQGVAVEGLDTILVKRNGMRMCTAPVSETPTAFCNNGHPIKNRHAKKILINQFIQSDHIQMFNVGILCDWTKNQMEGQFFEGGSTSIACEGSNLDAFKREGTTMIIGYSRVKVRKQEVVGSCINSHLCEVLDGTSDCPAINVFIIAFIVNSTFFLFAYVKRKIKVIYFIMVVNVATHLRIIVVIISSSCRHLHNGDIPLHEYAKQPDTWHHPLQQF